MPLRVAAYTRISTEEQPSEDRRSLRGQLADIKRLCALRSHVIAKTYRDTVSEATSDYPGYQQMISDAKNHLFDAVAIAKLDQLGRSPGLQLLAIDELVRLGLEVLIVKEPAGAENHELSAAIQTLMEAFPEFERSKTVSRMSAGRREKAMRGGYSGGPPQFGYVSRGHELVVDEHEAEIIKKVFAWRGQRWTLKEIANQLNKECTTRRGCKWQPRQVSRILEHRGLYRGRYAYGDIESKGRQQAILR